MILLAPMISRAASSGRSACPRCTPSRLGEDRDIHAVIHDEDRAARAASRRNRARREQKLAPRRLLQPQLQDPRARREQHFRELDRIVAARRIDHRVELRRFIESRYFMRRGYLVSAIL